MNLHHIGTACRNQKKRTNGHKKLNFQGKAEKFTPSTVKNKLRNLHSTVINAAGYQPVLKGKKCLQLRLSANLNENNTKKT